VIISPRRVLFVDFMTMKTIISIYETTARMEGIFLDAHG
jgi:hypothetical protein